MKMEWQITTSFLHVKINVDNNDDLVCIKKCYASCFSKRIMEYRNININNLINSNISIAVIIQEMIDADYAGVMFTTNTKTNNPDEMQINIVKGLEESLVSGKENSLDYIVDNCYNIVKEPKSEISDKKLIIELSKQATIIEDSYQVKRGLDIEFAIKDGEIYILQNRTIANYYNIDKRKDRTILDNSNIIESYSGVTTPLTFIFAREVYGKYDGS